MCGPLNKNGYALEQYQIYITGPGDRSQGPYELLPLLYKVSRHARRAECNAKPNELEPKGATCGYVVNTHGED